MKKIFKKDIGITLVALVVTIILLLILAGVAISSIGGEHGLFKKAIEAEHKNKQAQIREKILLMLSDYQIEKTYKNITLLEYFNNKKGNEIQRVIDNGKIIKIAIDGYGVDINKETLEIENIDIYNDIELNYMVTSVENDLMQIIINVKDNSGTIKEIELPNKSRIDIKGKQHISINYEVTNGIEYIFKIYTINNEVKDYVLKATTTETPKILENESNAYPIITESGIIICKTIEIDYGDNDNNYFSIDGGETWNKYNGKICVTKNTEIMANSIIKNEITKVSKQEVVIKLADDALSSNAYDDNGSTCHLPIEKQYTYYVDVDPSALEMQVFLKWYSGTNTSRPEISYIEFLDSSGEVIDSDSISSWSVETTNYTIPIGTEEVRFRIPSIPPSNDRCAKIYEFNIINEPKINAIRTYPILKEDGMQKAFDTVTIDYHKTSVEKLYKIDDGNWQKYTENGIRLETGQTIYAKAIDYNGKETRSIGSFKSVVRVDELGHEAYDNNYSTCYLPIEEYYTYYVNVAPSALEMQVFLKWYSGTNTSRTEVSYIEFLDSSGEVLESDSISSWSVETTDYTIPRGTEKVRFRVPSIPPSNDRCAKIYEFNIINAPKINAIRTYPILKENGIEKAFDTVIIDYHKTSVEKLYKIDDGDWQKYTENSIRLETGQTIYAKAIDYNGKETRSEGTFKSVVREDELAPEAYDKNNSTYALGSQKIYYINTDSLVIGKTINVIWYSGTNTSRTEVSYIEFLDSSGEVLESDSISSWSTETTSYIIPTGTEKIRFTLASIPNPENFRTAKVYEITY